MIRRWMDAYECMGVRQRPTADLRLGGKIAEARWSAGTWKTVASPKGNGVARSQITAIIDAGMIGASSSLNHDNAARRTLHYRVCFGKDAAVTV